MTISVHRAGARTSTPWLNGLGTTSEITKDTSHGDYAWRVSLAAIARDSTFSTFAGMQRIITVFGGSGVRLRTGEQGSRELHAFDVHRFDGAVETRCELRADPVRALNLIYRAERITARIQWPVLTRSRPFLSDAAIILVYNIGPAVLINVAKNPEIELGDNDLLQINNAAGSTELVLHGTTKGRWAIIELWET
ncbi:HutD family protein [Paeniglutamicibacter antarcticus]|uniref:HutD family protein n=1 Tax=Arthrobacter terrae TaxID=2935737 RepID=A0A931G8R5_9MICC|nr:HutD family protein [Arthrobacter terrae]MBG0737967.1 HutD family protein [Arthrobacter terrae]